ncbi:MAG: hypothetical protein P8M11_10815 [Planctomycetota bacterium]|nr:hypothetical protein [Planctomycetota bacterium]
MLPLITALIASAVPVPPAAAPLTTFQDDDRRRDELRAEARDIERMIGELHEKLGWIEREMEELDRHHEEHHEDHHGEEHRERRVIVMGLGEEGDGRQIVIDGEHSELIELLVMELMEGEERHERHHDDHGDHDDHDGHHEVRRFEFPGGHGEVHIRMEMEGEDEMEFDLGELLSEFGFGDHDLGGREIHMEVEIESEGDHGEEGEHHERHVERRVIHVGGNEVIELDGSEFIEFDEASGFSISRGGERAMEPRERGMPPEAMQALQELREEVRAMRREMNEMRRRFDRRD